MNSYIFPLIISFIVFGLILLAIDCGWDYFFWKDFKRRMEQKNKEWNKKMADAFVKELMKDEKVLAMLKEHAKKIKEENNDTRTND